MVDGADARLPLIEDRYEFSASLKFIVCFDVYFGDVKPGNSPLEHPFRSYPFLSDDNDREHKLISHGGFHVSPGLVSHTSFSETQPAFGRSA